MSQTDESIQTAEPHTSAQLRPLPAAVKRSGRDGRRAVSRKGRKPVQEARGEAARSFDLRQHKFLQALSQQLASLRSAMAKTLETQRAKTSALQIAKDLLQRSYVRDDRLACVNFALAASWVLSRVEIPSRTELAVQERLVERACELLELAGIHPRTSNFSHMHADLYRSLAGRYFSCGMPEKAAWATEFARYLDPQADRAMADDLLLGKAKAAAGAVADAAAHFDAAAASPHVCERAEAALWQLRLAWWSGETAARLHYDALIVHEFSADETVLTEHRWLMSLMFTFESGDLSPVLGAIERGVASIPYSVRAACILFAHACQTRRWREELSRIPTSRLYGGAEPEAKPLRRFLVLMARLSDANIPHSHKMALVRDVASAMDRLIDPLCRMLAAAALARWLRGVKQPSLATLFAHRYANESAVLSRHRSHDLFDLVADFATCTRQDPAA